MENISFTYAYDHANYFSRELKGLENRDLFACLDEKSQGFFDRISKPRKHSLLHELLECHIHYVYEYMIGHYLYDEYIEEIKIALKDNDITPPRWLYENEIDNYSDELDELLQTVITSEVKASFHLLFANRNFLFDFQSAISEKYIKCLKKTDHPTILKRDGVLTRPRYIPKWLKKAVFYRDQGRCQICWKDISGLMAPNFDCELDHIIPLAASGTNDPTNFQLICKECNIEKSDKVIVKPSKTILFW